MGLESECRRRSQQSDIFHSIAEQRFKDALQTGKEPPSTLSDMMVA